MIKTKYPDKIILMSLEQSDRKNKKWVVVFKSNHYYHKTVHFGDSRYQDFTQHKDTKRAYLYQQRHRNDNLDLYYSPGALSYHILWSDNNIRDGLKNYIEPFNIEISPSVKKKFNL